MHVTSVIVGEVEYEVLELYLLLLVYCKTSWEGTLTVGPDGGGVIEVVGVDTAFDVLCGSGGGGV